MLGLKCLAAMLTATLSAPLRADWLKRGAFSVATESCFAIKEPMKSAYLDDLRKAGLPEK